MRKKLISLAATFAAVALCGGIAAYSPTASAETVTTDKMYCAGASIRIAEEGDQTGSGIRFCVEMLKADFLALDGAATGMLVLPTDMADADLTHEDANVKVVDLATSWRDVVKEDVAYVQAYAYLWEIPEDSYNREMSWRGFYGEEGSYVYTETTQSRSVASVALAAEAAGEEGAEEFLLDYDVTFAWGYETDAAAPAQTQEVKYGSKAVQPDTDPVREGYTFAGWDYDFDTVVTGDVEVVATWTMNPVHITDFKNIDFSTFIGVPEEVTSVKPLSIGTFDNQTVLVAKEQWKPDGGVKIAFPETQGLFGATLQVVLYVESTADVGCTVQWDGSNGWSIPGTGNMSYTTLNEWQTYEYPFYYDGALNEIVITPGNPSKAYNIYIKSVKFFMAESAAYSLDFSSMSAVPAGVVRNTLGQSINTTEKALEFKSTQSKVGSIFNTNNSVNFLYGGVTMPKGTKITAVYKRTIVQGWNFNINGAYKKWIGGLSAVTNEWETFTYEFDADTVVYTLGFSIGINTASTGYIQSFVVEFPQA